MPSSPAARLAALESDLLARPMRISVIRDMPFAIFRYDPHDEWLIRREVAAIATRLRNRGLAPFTVSLEHLLWDALDRIADANPGEGLDALSEMEKTMGPAAAHAVLRDYLSLDVWAPLSDQVFEALGDRDPATAIGFLFHAAALGPDLYPISRLLDDLHGRTRVPLVLFYPGTIEGATGLRFLDLRDREPMGNYRVRIY